MDKTNEWLTQQGQEDVIKEDVIERLEEQDEINHPTHYNFGSIEPIDVVEDWDLDYHLGTVLKYIARAGLKEGSSELKDLKKAQWYLNRKVQNLKTQEDNEKWIEDLQQQVKKADAEMKQEDSIKEGPLKKLAKAIFNNEKENL